MKHFRHLRKTARRSKKAATLRPYVLGITGADRGVGVTHLSLTAATFFSSYERMKTACIEIGTRSSLFRLSETLSVTSLLHTPLPGFSYGGTDYFPAVPETDEADLRAISSMPYDRIVLDVQDFRTLLFAKLPLDRLFLLGGTQPWNDHSFRLMLQALAGITCASAGELMSHGGAPERLRQSEREFQRSITGIPYIANPFSLSRADIRGLQPIL